MTNSVIIYSPKTSDRLSYVLDFVFKSKGVDYFITQNFKDFENSEYPKINYSNEPSDFEGTTINVEGLLFENGIRQKSELKHIPDSNFWLINDVKDHFSVIFFMLTCYEEYYIKDRDEHDRFSAKHSTLYKFNRLHKPNVDLLVKHIWEALNLDYSAVKNQFKQTITFDIDSAFAIKNKSKSRQIVGDLKAILKGQSLKERKLVRKGDLKDPFDTFDIIEKIALTHDVICFILIGDWGKYDKNIAWTNVEFQDILKRLSHKCRIGIHPSYQSYLSQNKINAEIKRLKKILQTKVELNRQHFLKLKLPDSYEILSNIGIKSDYSMGFADAYGFRAGTSFAYPFFNLKTNTTTGLTIYPISYMDGTLNQYLKLSIENSINIIKDLKQEVENVGGHFIPLWHNETINNKGIWKNWLKVLEQTL